MNTGPTLKLRRTISPALLPPRPMELGKIKIGGKGQEVRTKTGATMRIPVKYDHFIVTRRKRGADDNFVLDQEVHASIGDGPEHLDVRLMFDSVEENFQSEMLVYKGHQKVFVCDGERAENLTSGRVATCLRREGKECPCKPFGRLAVILEAAPQYGGFYLFRTTSWETINNLQTTLSLLQAQFGSLRGLPLRLVVYPATDQREDGTSTSYKVGIVLRADYETARTVALEFHRADRIELRELKLLASGVEETIRAGEDEDAEDIAEEFVLDPERREELERLQASERTLAATQAQLTELKAKVGAAKTKPRPEPQAEVKAEPKRSTATATREPPAPILVQTKPIADGDFGPEYGIELPDWDKDAKLPANPPKPEPQAHAEVTKDNGQAEKSDFERARAAYFATWRELWQTGIPGEARPLNAIMSSDEVGKFRADWQEEQIGKRSASRFSEEEFRKARLMLKEGMGLPAALNLEEGADPFADEDEGQDGAEASEPDRGGMPF